ncbi:MAG: hypothetical protein IT184_10705 [Acidobacteria bacterium]|nr:hypothetical protein [Acidobacteriota bacterium]
MSVGHLIRWAVVAAVGASLGATSLGAQSGTVGSVRLPRAVLADGQPLPAGTYTLRLANDPIEPVVGQSQESTRWVEFVQSGAVKGRELASVVRPAELKDVAESAPPAPGAARVQLLRGAEYLRVWANIGGTQYLVHLGLAPGK